MLGVYLNKRFKYYDYLINKLSYLKLRVFGNDSLNDISNNTIINKDIIRGRGNV